ncbi:hypothetical protein [Enterococcus faecalis]|nr:hypothetical protein [Enterococcus faecalis]MCU9783490.1 hypothetical protein [Enterococcus faecalis]MCU9795442.1 hypothetical protein [Enterococcus faecalis]MCU9797824.1 hypothetical protein [Enterococcus faecalis]
MRCCDFSVGAKRQLLGLSTNRLANDQLAKVLAPQVVNGHSKM